MSAAHETHSDTLPGPSLSAANPDTRWTVKTSDEILADMQSLVDSMNATTISVVADPMKCMVRLSFSWWVVPFMTWQLIWATITRRPISDAALARVAECGIRKRTEWVE